MIKYAAPEEKGLSSDNILAFCDKLKAHHIPMHSVVLYKDDSIVSECYYSPFKKGELHRMFSVSKSVTALAIGLLADSGRLSLDDKIVTYFPDKVPSPCHKWLADMTIRDMLMMRTCHVKSTYNKFDLSSDWVGSFFNTVPTKKSGTVFHYDTSAAHVLAALTERLTGTALWDYFRDTLPELELSEDSYILKDGQGVSMGGTGLVATTDDLLKIGILLLNDGSYNGKQLISAKYIREATSLLTHNCVASPLPSEGSGYGYMIWRTERNGFVCYGMGGQLIIVHPQYRIILITTADTQGLSGANQLIYNTFYDEILDKLPEKLSDACPSSDTPEKLSDACPGYDAPANALSLNRLREYEATAQLEIAAPPESFASDSSCKCSLKQLNTGKFHEYTFTDSSYFTGIELMLPDINDDNSEGMLTLKTRDTKLPFPFYLGRNKADILPGYNYKCYSSGYILDESTLYIKTSIIDSIVGSIHFELYFGDNDVTVFIKKIEETMLNEFNATLYGVKNEN